MRLGAQLVPNAEFERRAQQVARARIERIAPAMVRPYREWLTEDYYIFIVNEVSGEPKAADLVAQHGGEIAQIVRGEQNVLARSEQDDVLGTCLSYYPNDLVVVGWNAALIYDNPAGASTSV